MRILRIVFGLMSLVTISFLAGSWSPVLAQGGTGKMPPIQRMPPPIQRMPPQRRELPQERRQVATDIYVVPVTASRSMSTTDRVPETLGLFKRDKLDTHVPDDTNTVHGAVEVLRADYGNDIVLFLSRFKDTASANNAMQSLGKKTAGSYNTVSRKHLRSRSGQALGEFWLLKSSGKEKKAQLLLTNGAYLYRVYGNSTEDAQKVFKSLPLE
jgi:RNA binding exosome subunit